MLYFWAKLCEVSALCFEKLGDKSDISLNLFMSSYSLLKNFWYFLFKYLPLKKALKCFSNPKFECILEINCSSSTVAIVGIATSN